MSTPSEGGPSLLPVALTVNGTRHELELEPRDLLVHVLRERLALTGTNVGCDTSSCGACTVLHRRRVGEVVHRARRPGRRRRDHDDRGSRRRRRAASGAAGVPRSSRVAVRLLHARHGDGGRLADREWRRERRAGDSARARGQPLSLYRLPQHRRSGRRGGRERPRWPSWRRASSARPSSARRMGRCSPATARSSTISICPERSRMVVVRSPYAHARDHGHRRGTRRSGAEGIVAVLRAPICTTTGKAERCLVRGRSQRT